MKDKLYTALIVLFTFIGIAISIYRLQLVLDYCVPQGISLIDCLFLFG